MRQCAAPGAHRCSRRCAAPCSRQAPSALLGELALSPAARVRTLAGERHQRHAVAARVGDPLDVDADDRAALLCQHVGAWKLERVAGQHLAVAVEAQDPRRALKRAQHHHDPAVLLQVGDRLGAAADEVQVRERTVIEQPQRADRALGRDVDMTVVPARRGRDEEHRLALDPSAEKRLDPLVDLSHESQASSAGEDRLGAVPGLARRGLGNLVEERQQVRKEGVVGIGAVGIVVRVVGTVDEGQVRGRNT